MFLGDRGVLGKTATTKTGGCFLSFFIFKFTSNNHFFLLLDYVFMARHHTFVRHPHIPT